MLGNYIMRCKKDYKGNISYTFDEKHQHKRVQEYWTPERKAAALPEPGCQTDELQETSGDVSSATDPELADTTQMPFAAGGKLFFSLNNQDYVASAEILCQSNIVLTAAHCVQDKDSGALCDNFLFERCYSNGKSLECLTFQTVALKTYWHEQKKWKWDYALAILNDMSTLASPLTYSTENVVGKQLTAFGYPTNYEDGERMVRIDGTADARGDGTLVINGDKMRNGCSGGAWVLQGENIVVGINSFSPSSGSSSVYVGSPVLDTEFDSLYQYVISLF